MNNSKVSVLMPIYNSDRYLNEAIQSIVSQTFTDFELIIINDTCVDTSKEIALEWASKDRRITVIENKYKKGIAGALNSGLDISTGEFIARADADDINKLHRIEAQVRFFTDHKHIDIVGTGYQLFGNGYEKKVFHPTGSITLAWKFITNTYLCHPSVMFRRSVLKTVAKYPDVPCEDFAFFSKIIQKYKGENIKEIFINYRQHNQNYSNIQNNKIKISVKETFKENYFFYTNSLEYADIFYNFQAKQDLCFKDLYKILCKSFIISKKILTLYSFRKISLEAFCLYCLILSEIKLSLLKHYGHVVFK